MARRRVLLVSTLCFLFLFQLGFTGRAERAPDREELAPQPARSGFVTYLREQRKTRWKVIIYWARHGQSCANAMQDRSEQEVVPTLRFKKNFLPDPVLTDCGVHRTQQAGEKFAKWAWKHVKPDSDPSKAPRVDIDELTMAHYGDDVYKGLDMIASSSLFRAMETTLFQFGRMRPVSGPAVFPLPYISEHTDTADNTASAASVQRDAWSSLTFAIPPGRPIQAGAIGNSDSVSWSDFVLDYKWLDQPHLINGEHQSPGVGRDESHMDKFTAFLAENVIPELAARRVNSKADDLRVVRLGISSHSSFLKSVFEKACNLSAKPWNNDVLAVPYIFEIDDADTPTLDILSEDGLEEFCNPQTAPVSFKNVNPDFQLLPIPKKLCEPEIRRCEQQIDRQNIKYLGWRFGTGLRSGAVSQCTCMPGEA